MTPERLKQIEDNVRAHQADRPGMVSPGWALRVAPELIAHIRKLEAERDEAQKWLVVFAREVAEIVGASVTPIDLDAIREAVRAKIEAMGGGEG